MTRNIAVTVPSQRRAFGKALAAVFCFLLLTCAAFSGEEPQTMSIKKQFEKKISEMAGMPVAVKDYKISYATVKLTGVKIGDPARPDLPSAQIKELSAACDLMSLLGGNLVMKEINIKSLKATISLDADGKLVLGEIKKPAPSGLKSGIENLPFDKIIGSNFELRVTSQKSNTTVLLQLPSLTAARSDSGKELAVDFSGNVSLADAKPATATSMLPIKVSIKAQELRPLQASGAVTIDSSSAETLLALIKALMPERIDGLRLTGGKTGAELKFAMAAAAPLQFSFTAGMQNIGSVVYNASPEIKQVSATMAVTGKISDGLVSADIEITDASLSIPDKKVELHKLSAKLKAESAVKKYSLNGSVSVPRFDIAVPVSATNRSSYVFPFLDVNASFSYAGNDFTITSAQAKLFGGTLDGSGKVLPGKTPVRLQINAKGSGLRVESFLDSNTTQKQVITGPVGGTLNADGDVETLTSWNGNGSLLMQNGRYNTPPVVTPFLSLINLKEFASGDITEARGTFVLRQGIMTTNDLNFLSSAGRAEYRGDVGLDTSLKGNLEIRFSQAAVAKSQVLRQISLDGKTANIPSRVEGTLLAPSFPGFNSGKLLELGLQRQGQKILQDILNPRSKEPASTETAPATKKTDPAKELLKGLGNLFKRKRK